MNTLPTFAEPAWLVAGVVVVGLLILFFRLMVQKRQEELARFASSHLLGKLCASVSSRRRMFKKAALLLGVLCCFAALARPQYGVKWVDVKRKGIDILFAIDTSKSMLAEDVRPNRLQRAKYGVLDFVGQLGGDRVGLMPFAGSAFLMCPMTIDYSAFESSLKALDTTIIPKGGTDLSGVIREAEAVLSNEANHKILVLITDGENLEGDTLEAATRAAEKGMTIYTVGVGTSEGELIPLGGDGKSGFVKDSSGKFITSQLDEKGLTEIAERTNGLYVPLGAEGEGLQTIYQQKLSLIPKEELAEKRHKVPLERFIWPLGAAIILLMIEFLVGGRKSKRSLKLPFVKTAGRRKQKAAAMVLCCGLLAGAVETRASIGEDAYEAEDYLTASQYYTEQLERTPDDPMLHYNYGTAAYKNNLFDDAAQSFTEALKSGDLQLQELAYYNRGNAYFQQGQESVATDKQHTIDLWQQAVQSYEGALALNEANDDASFNLELVKKKLEELQKEQEQEEEQEQEKQQNQQQEQDKQENQEQGQQQSDQQSQDGGEQEQEQEQNSQQDGEEQSGEEQQEAQPGNADGQQEQDAQSAQQEEGEEPKQAEQEASAEASQEKQERQARQVDQARREQGKMTSDEAEQLLNSLKDEEGKLNFVPAGLPGAPDNQETTRDW